MNLNQTDLLVSHVLEAKELIEKILGFESDYFDENFAQFTVGGHCLMLSTDALIPMKTIQSGTILHLEVADVEAEQTRLIAAGITILMQPTTTDWGTYSLLVEGPDEVVFDFYQKAV